MATISHLCKRGMGALISISGKTSLDVLRCSICSICFICFTYISTSQAQVASNSYCQDFTVTDIKGNQFNLYETLDSDKIVILDIMATWCSACWIFHKKQILENLNAQRGQGSKIDDVRILMIEGDSLTTLDNLTGKKNGRSTQCDWTAETPFPIIDGNDGAKLATRLKVRYFPTLYIITPDRHISELLVGQLTGSEIDKFKTPKTGSSKVDSLFELSAAYPHIFEYLGDKSTYCDSKKTNPSIRLQNLGRAEMTSCDILMRINGIDQQTISWSGKLKTHETDTVTFNEMTLSNTNMDIGFQILNANGFTIPISAQNRLALTIPIGATVESDTLFLEIKTDYDYKETSWKITDDTGRIIKSGGNPNVIAGKSQSPISNIGGQYTAPFTTYQDTILLPSDGCYTFLIQDEFGDGMHNIGPSKTGAEGYYNLYTETPNTPKNCLISGGNINGLSKKTDFISQSYPIQKKSSINTTTLTTSLPVQRTNVRLD
jgi:hypothetical protein